MIRVVSWNVARRRGPLDELSGMDADVALLQEVGSGMAAGLPGGMESGSRRHWDSYTWGSHYPEDRFRTWCNRWPRVMVVERKDIAEAGRAMYRELRSELEANHWGRVVVIDVNTGDYEVDDDGLNVTLRLRERNPGAITWGVRVGYPAPYRMSSRATFVPSDERPCVVD